MKEYRIDGLRITFGTYAEAREFIRRFNKKYIDNILKDEIEMLDTDDIKEMYFFETAEEAIKWSSQPDWFEALGEGMNKLWRSQTYGKIEFDSIPEKLLKFYDSHKIYGEPIEITIGTDSQNRSEYTKIVSVISIICRGHGGIFFHQVEYLDVISNVKVKLETETNRSLEIAQALLGKLEEGELKVLYENCPLSIHIDAGNASHGKTKDLITSLVGWVHAMGYECEVKPNAWTASTIADRISK